MTKVTDKFEGWKIFDCYGIEMPGHYSGRDRTYEEAKKMMDRLNKTGEYRPYRIEMSKSMLTRIIPIKPTP